jgi:hypothetical protein
MKKIKFSHTTTKKTLASLMRSKISYKMKGMEGKVSSLRQATTDSIRFLDCSGFVQYVFYKISPHHTRIPGGSRRQRSWLEQQGYARVLYSAEASKMDNVVRIAFRNAEHNEKRERTRAGHVWFIINGKTYESTTKRGRNGPTSFSWNLRTTEAHHCFVLGKLAKNPLELKSLSLRSLLNQALRLKPLTFGFYQLKKSEEELFHL